MPIKPKRRKHIKKSAAFPNISKKNHVVCSDQDAGYNCIAFAAGVTARKWWPTFQPDFDWPLGPPYSEFVECFVRAFQTKGYHVCDSGAFEPGVEKVVFFEDMGRVKHAAVQIGPDKWASKLGDLEDITHKLSAVAGGLYGKPTVYMARKKP